MNTIKIIASIQFLGSKFLTAIPVVNIDAIFISLILNGTIQLSRKTFET
jgi:hypothetical protein